MIAIDVDGTLLGAEGKVSARNLGALKAVAAAGIEVVIATGRRHSYAMRVLRGLGLAEDFVVVSSNGAVVRTVGAALIERTFLPHETAMWLCEHLDEFRNAMVITFDMVQPDGDDARGALVVEELEELHGSIGRWMVANEPYIEHVVPIKAALTQRAADGESPIQMMLCGGIERMRRAEARLLEHQAGQARITLSRTEYPERDLSLVDILPAGCSKGSALRRLAEVRGIGLESLMAIGDNWNDLSMLEIAGRPVLMGNAPQDLQELARAKGWKIGEHHLEDGVAEAIETVLDLHAEGTPRWDLGSDDALLSGSLRG